MLSIEEKQKTLIQSFQKEVKRMRRIDYMCTTLRIAGNSITRLIT